MLYNKLHQAMLAETCRVSKFETKREYISLSGIYKEPEDIVLDYLHGATTDTAGLLKCYIGYHAERGMKERLVNLDGYSEHEEVTLEGFPLFKGHPDFKYHGLPSECKSYALDAYLPKDCHAIGKRVHYQMQAYMLGTKQTESLILCESRESGRISTVMVYANAHIQDHIMNKAEQVYKLLNLL